MYNKNIYRKANDKKLLHKVGKQWVTVSIAMLALIGGGAIASTTTTHADTTTPATEVKGTNNNVKEQLNSGLAKAYQTNQSASDNNTSSANSSAPTSARANNVQSQAGKMYRGLMLNVARDQQRPSGSTTISSTNNSRSNKVGQPTSNSDSGNGMTTLKLSTPSQQARGWNFVQHGINHDDYANTSVNSVRASSVSNNASGNQVAPVVSANAKSNVAMNAPINAHKPFNSAMQSYNAQMSGTDAQVANANSINAESNSGATNHKAMLKDDSNTNQVTDTLQYQDSDGNDVGYTSVVQGIAGSTLTKSDMSDIKNNVPSGYTWSNDPNKENNSVKPIQFKNSDAPLVIPVNAIQQNGNIDVNPNEVTVTGTIKLQFNNKDGNITTVPLQYGFQTSDDNKATPSNSDGNAVNALKHADFFDNVSDPNGYAENSDIFRLDNGQPINSKDFTYTGATGNNAPYMIDVSKQDGDYANGSQHHIFKDITLTFNYNPNNANTDTEAINYVDPDGNNVGSRTVTAPDGTQLPTANSNKQGTIGGNVPKGYTINGNNPAIVTMHKGGNQIIHVTPINNTPADITGATQPQPNGQKPKIISGNNGTNGQNGKDDKTVDGTTPSQLNKGGVVPKGYHVDPNNPVAPDKNPDGTQKTNKDGKPEYTVNVQPNNEHMVIRYYYENNGKQIFVGDDHLTGAYNSSDTVNDSNDKGLDSGYQLINGNPANTFKFGSDRDDNNIVKVPVSIKTTSQTVTLHNSSDKPVNSDDKPVSPQQAKTIIIKGQDGHTITPSDLNKSGQLPKGYHATTGVIPGAKDKNGNPLPQSVKIAPNSEHEFVQYYYTDAKGNKIQVGNTVIQGNYGTSDTLNDSSAKGLDSGYQLTGKSDSFKFGSDRNDNNITQVPVKPQAFTNKDTVTFKDINGKTIGNGTVPTDSTPSDADKDIEGKGSNKNDKNQVPNGYHIINSDQTITPDNSNHTVLVAPNSGTPAIMNAKYPNGTTTKIIGKDGKPLNGINGQKITPSDLDNSGLLPKGYHANNGAIYGNNGKDGNTPQIINIAPNEEHEIVRYYLEDKGGQKVFVGDDYFTGMNGAQGDVKASDAKGLSTGYHLANKDNTFTFNAPSDKEDSNVDDVPVNLIKSNNSDSVQFVNLDNNDDEINDNSDAPSFSVGKQAPSDMIADSTIQSKVPTGYYMVDPNQAIYYNGTTHSVVIASDTENETIDYDNSGKSMSNTATGKYGQQGNANDYVPQGYHLKTNPDGSVVTKDGAKVSPTFTFGKGQIPNYEIEPNQSADTIIYVDDDNNTNNGNTVGSYTTGGGFANQPLSGNDVVAPHPANNSIDTYNNVPAGYQIDPSSNNRTDLTYDGLTHVIYVNGIKQQPQNVTVNIIAKDNNGKAITGQSQKNGIYDSFPIQESGIIGDTYTINPTDGDVMSHVPAGSAPVPSDEPQSGEITTNGLTNKTINFTYDAPAQNSNDIMVYYRTKDGKTINSGVIDTSKASINSKGDVTQKVQVPKGYAVDSGENTQYTVTSKPQYLSFTVHGLPAKDVDNLNPNRPGLTPEQKQAIEDKTKISIIYIYRNQQSSFTRTYQQKFNLDNSTIGSTMLIYPASGIQGTSTPQGYTEDPTDKIITSTLTANGATPGQITYIYNAQNRAVNFNFHSKNNKGQTNNVPGSNQTVNGNTGSDITNNINIPEGYHIIPGEHIHVPENNNTRTTVDVNIAGNHVVGHAKLNLLYERGNHVSDEVKILPISGSIGDSDVVIDPQDFDKQGYQVSTASDWKIPFDINNVKRADGSIKEPDGTRVYGDTFRYTPEQTFVYKASPLSIQINYVDTQTSQQVKGTTAQFLSDVAYDGDTADLEDSNASNDTISIDGHNYNLHIPQGYHLAHANNYVKVTANGTYTKKVSNSVGGFRMVRMPLMKLTLGIMPHFNHNNNKPAKPASGSATPAKPASQGSVTPTSSSSTSSVAPSSASSASSSSASTSSEASSGGNTYISNTSYISYVTNNYSSSANTANSYANASTATPVITPVVDPIVMPTVNSASENTANVSASAKPTEVVNNDNDNNTIYNIGGSKANKLIQHMPVGSKMYHKNVTIKRLSQKKLGLYYIMVTRPTWIYRGTRFTRRNRIRVIKPKDIIAVPIQRIFRVNGRMVFQIRIRVNRHRHSAFITSNRKYVRNAYIQPKESRGHHYVRVIRNAELYRSPRYSNRTRVGNIYRGAKLRIKRIRYIASKHMTRIQLTNDLWFTANKNFVKLIK